MIERLKSIDTYQWIVGTLIGAILLLVGFGWAQTDRRIEKKADAEQIKILLQQMEKQRLDDKEQRKEDREVRQKKDDQIFQLIQKLIENETE